MRRDARWDSAKRFDSRAGLGIEVGEALLQAGFRPSRHAGMRGYQMVEVDGGIEVYYYAAAPSRLDNEQRHQRFLEVVRPFLVAQFGEHRVGYATRGGVRGFLVTLA